MNSNHSPLDPPGPLAPRRFGCLGILAVLVALLILGFFALRYAITGTALLFRAVASLLQKGSSNLQINGITGNLATGPSVASITWGGDPAQRSEVLDLRVKYNGLTAARAERRLILHEVGVRKAHIDLTDLSGITTTSSGSRNSPTPGSSAPAPTSSGDRLPGNFDSFEIQRVIIEDVLLTNRHTEFRLSIPKIEWTGFKVTEKGVEPGELTVESDRLKLHTSDYRQPPGTTATLPFQKTLTGTALPLLHPAIRQPINFTVDFSFDPRVPAHPFHLTAAEGKLQFSATTNGHSALQVEHLDLATYLDGTALFVENAGDLPSDLVLEAASTPGFGDEVGLVKIVRGSFRLGVADFQIEPAEYVTLDQPDATLQAVSRDIRWSLPLKNVFNEFRPRLSSTSGLPPNEILARVFAGRTYAELSAEQKAAVEARLPAYFPVPIP